jgi:predicted RNase H-like HicB family nuclease
MATVVCMPKKYRDVRTALIDAGWRVVRQVDSWIICDDDYVVIHEQAEDGVWGAYFPDLPGVVAVGATRSEAQERIEEALAAYADELRGRSGSLPAPHHAAGTVASGHPIARAVQPSISGQNHG